MKKYTYVGLFTYLLHKCCFRTWLYNIARGIDLEPVTIRLASKSIGCCKKFPGITALTETADIKHWLKDLSEEIIERLDEDMKENNRKAKQIVLSFVQSSDCKDVSTSKTLPLVSYDVIKIASDSFELLRKQCLKNNGSFCLKFLGLSAGKFEELKKTGSIVKFLNLTKEEPFNPDRVAVDAKQKLYTEMEYIEGSWSDATENLSEDESKLKFYGESDILDNTETNQNFSNVIEESDTDSITNELFIKYKSDKDDEESTTKSFFLQYFKDKQEMCNASSIRFSNGSKIFWKST